jgi:hypothetical protein
MIRYCCDICDKDVPEKELTYTREIVYTDFKFKVLQSHRDVANSGHLCEECFLFAIQEGELR